MTTVTQVDGKYRIEIPEDEMAGVTALISSLLAAELEANPDAKDRYLNLISQLTGASSDELTLPDPRYPVIEPEDFGPALNEAFLRLRGVVIDADEQLMMIMFAIATLEHALLIAGPGVGKSFSSKLVMKLLPDALKLWLQITRDMMPEQIFGNIIPELLLKLGEEHINLEGGAAAVEFVIAEEMMDGPMYLLRAMLTLMSEREFSTKAMGRIDTPLHTLIGLTNFFRMDEEGLEAVFDRFLSIMVMPEVQSLDGLYEIINGYMYTEGADDDDEDAPTFTVRNYDGFEVELPRFNYSDLHRFARWLESTDGPSMHAHSIILHILLHRKYMAERAKMIQAEYAKRHGLDLEIDENWDKLPDHIKTPRMTTPRRVAWTTDYARASAAFNAHDYVTTGDLRAGGFAYIIVGEGKGYEPVWKGVCDELLEDLSEDDFDRLDKIARLISLIREMKRSRGVMPEAEMTIGGDVFLFTRVRMMQGHDWLSRKFGSGVHPAIELAMEFLHESIESLDKPVSSIGAQVNGWGWGN